MEKIAFYFRKNVLAKGDFALYYRFASYFAEHFDCSVYCVNNSFPELQKGYLDKGIKFCDIDENTKKELEGATFVTAFNQVFFMLDEIKDVKNAKVALLFLHPQIVNWLLNQVSPKKFRLDEFMKLLCENNAYGFMDKSNYIAAKKFSDEKFEERYFPVSVAELEERKFLPYVDDGSYNFAWMGRMDRDKIFSVSNFLDNLSEVNADKPINFHMVGDGNAKREAKAENYFPKIRLFYTSYLYGEECHDYLRNNADVVIAMGISALDVAALGIPTIIPIVSPKKFRADKYVWFYDVKGYSLGWNEEDFKELGCPSYTSEQVFDEIYGQGGKETLGKKCYEFVKENFSVEKNAQSVFDLIRSSELTVEKLLSCKSVKSQLRQYKLFKILKKDAEYADFVTIREKIKKFRAKSFGGKVKTVLKRLGRAGGRRNK